MRRLKTSGTLCAFSLALAIGASPALAQDRGQDRNQGQGANARAGGNHGGAADKGTQELIGHALSMAIESSALMSIAQQGGYSRSSATGSGSQGTRSGGTADSQRNAGAGGDDYRVVGAAGSPGMSGYAAAQLQQHARRGFEESHRLFREAARSAGDANSPLGRYLSTAQSYARSLELYSGQRSGSTTGTGGAVSDRGIPGEAVFRTGSAARAYRADESANGAGGQTAGMLDPQTICLMNHGVTEVLDACKLKSMARMLGENSQGVDVLRQHAQQMQAEGRQVIQTLAATSDVPAARGAGGTGRGAASGTGGSLLDAATARTRDRDVTTTSGDRGGAGTTGGTGTTGTGAGTGAAGSRTGTGATSGGTGGPGTTGGAGTGAGDSGLGTGGAGARGSAMITLAQQAHDLVRIIDQLSSE